MVSDIIKEIPHGRANLLRFIFAVLAAIIILIAVMSSMLLFQHRQNGGTGLSRELAKAVEITSLRENADSGRSLREADIDTLLGIAEGTAPCEPAVSRLMPFAVRGSGDYLYFVRSISDDFLTRMTGDAPGSELITARPIAGDKLTLSLPVVTKTGGSLQSSERAEKTFAVRSIPAGHPLTVYFANNELLAGEKLFAEISGIMVPEAGQETLQKIWLIAEDNDGAEKIAAAAEAAGFNTNYEALRSYTDPDRASHSLRTGIFVMSILLVLSSAAMFIVWKL